MRHDTATTQAWMRDGTAILSAVTDALTDADLAAPSALPGWTRAHVVGHLARNAEALVRLATWARTGVETPMYASSEQRAAEIEASARYPPQRLRAELAETATQLDAALDALTAEQWRAPVRSALGRAIPAAEIPWMRVREVWLHAVDLDAGTSVTDLPASVVDTLLDDVTGVLGGRDGCPELRLAATDRDRHWTLGGAEGPSVSGSAADLLGWLVGRTAGTRLTCDDERLPTIPRWL